MDGYLLYASTFENVNMPMQYILFYVIFYKIHTLPIFMKNVLSPIK